MVDKEPKNAIKSSKKAKKRLLIIITVIAVLTVILLVSSMIIDQITDKSNADTEYIIDYNFYPADYEENIFEDPDYLSLYADGLISFHDTSTNVTLGIDREVAATYGEDVKFIADFIYDIICGDTKAYNARFSDEYYKTHSKKSEFTMQKIYDVTVTYVSEEVISENGDYTKYNYTIEYKIYQNNGTYRKDIGDGSKKQYLTLSDSSGTLKIDELYTPRVNIK